MKSPLRKLRDFTFHKNESKEKKEQQKASKLDELVEAAKDMQDLKNCYDSILSAAATAANNAYEFSVALEELGSCFLEKAALTDDENGGRALMMLGRVHFELQKLFSSYRSHIYQTMVNPSKSLLGELEVLEEMKVQCDTKREAYKSMLMTHKGRGRSRNAKSEASMLKELQEAQADYENEASLFIFRLKSLKQGQFRSLLTQAARHHAAQSSFFRKGVNTLETAEPHVKVVADEQHISYQFIDLEDNDSDFDGDDNDDDYDGELSFDYKQDRQDQDVINISRSFEEETTDRSQPLYYFSLKPGSGSQSAPISADRKSDASEKIKPPLPSSRKFHSYALPTPTVDTNTTSASAKSTPLDAKSPTKDLKEIKLPSSTKLQTAYPSRIGGNIHSGPIPINAYSIFSEGLLFPQWNQPATSDTKNYSRQSFSGPLRPKGFANKARYSVSDYETPLRGPPVVSMAESHVSQKQSSASPPKYRSSPPISTPKISELHELPRPPVNPGNTSSLIGYSGPLISRGQATAAINKPQIDVSSKMSPLPAPPGPITRSFSIPTRGQRIPVLSVVKVVEVHGDSDSTGETASPALMPLSSTMTDKVSVMGGPN